jgi:hypothetical protein
MAVSILALHRHYYINQERAICSFDSCKKQMDATKDKVMRCAGCKVAPYCSKECQAGDWKRHKQICQLLKAPFSLERSPFTALFSSSSIKRSFPNRFFDASKVFITTNEANHAEVIESLAKQPAFGNTLVGVSALANLNMAAVRESVSNVLIIDPSSKVSLFMENFSLIIKAYEKKEDCVQALEAHIRQYLLPLYTEQYFIDCGQALRDIEIFCKKLSEKSSFFSSDEKFSKIRSLFLDGKVAFVQGDFSDAPFMSQVKKNLEALELKVDTLYLSNILDFISQEKMATYAANLNLLCPQRCLIVDTLEKPFKVTEFLSKYHKDKVLDRLVVAKTLLFQGVNPKQTSQQIKIKESEDASCLFPLLQLKLNEKVDEETLFYAYGLRLGFYSEQEAKKAHEIAQKAFKEQTGKSLSRNLDFELAQQLEALTLRAFDSLK